MLKSPRRACRPPPPEPAARVLVERTEDGPLHPHGAEPCNDSIHPLAPHVIDAAAREDGRLGARGIAVGAEILRPWVDVFRRLGAIDGVVRSPD